MKNKSVYPLITSLLVILMLIGCNSKTRVGFLMDESETGRWAKDKELFATNIVSLGGEIVIRASERDANKQLELAKEMLNKEKLDILVVVPTDLNSAAEIVKLAHQKNIPVVAYDRIIKNCDLDFYVSFDNIQVGELQAQYISTIVPKGKYALIGGSVADNNSFMIRIGLFNILEPLVQRGDIEIVFDKYADSWIDTEGYRLMKECIEKNPGINAVLCANDRLAQGAIEALTELNISPLPAICGQDADAEACQRLVAGTQSMTVSKPIEALSIEAAEITLQIAREKKLPKTYLTINNGNKLIPALLLKPMVVNQKTINLTVNSDAYMKSLHDGH